MRNVQRGIPPCVQTFSNCKDTPFFHSGKKNVSGRYGRRPGAAFWVPPAGCFSVRCPFVVRLLSVCCPFSKRTTNGQQSDNDRTTSLGTPYLMPSDNIHNRPSGKEAPTEQKIWRQCAGLLNESSFGALRRRRFLSIAYASSLQSNTPSGFSLTIDWG